MGYIELLVRNLEDYGIIMNDYIHNYYNVVLKEELKEIGMEELCCEDIYIVENNLLDTIQELKRVMNIK